ncbi:MAG: heavy metal translocating P-type ATPase [Pseudobdellovibrionaceae bacterium]
MPNSYDYLDVSPFRSAYVDVANPRTMKFYVDGIRCSKCISKIERLSSLNPELQSLEVDLANQMALIQLKSSEGSFSRVANDIAELGFRVVPMQLADDPIEAWKKESRRDLTRLAIAAFCAGNIMILAFATYFGLDGPLKATFEWLQLALYFPVVTFVAWPFYQGFFQGLKQKSLSIDGPMAIASLLGFGVSAWNLSRQSGMIYFDSLSGFLFLILATRYIQKRTRFEYLKYLRPTSLAETFRARLLAGQDWIWTRSDKLKKGDVVLFKHGEWAPADGELLDSEAVLDLSVLNGESMPRRVQNGFVVKAGSRLLKAEARLSVLKSGSETFLGNLLASLKRESNSGTQSAKLSDQASQILLMTVLIIAALTLLSGFAGSFEARFERALALIILACPCAMAFGTPLAFSFSMKRAQEKGIVIKSAQVFERIKDVRNVYLDKTGTVTERFWNLTESTLQEPPGLYKEIILQLEAKSQHPIAFALREIWSDVTLNPDWKLENWQEVPSVGVKGTIQNQDWEFRQIKEADGKFYGLFQQKTVVWKFRLRPVLQAGARKTVLELQELGFNIHLLSGDSVEETRHISRQLGLLSAQTFPLMTPQKKAQVLQENPWSMMIGDGVNDALALQAAQVGIAVRGGVELALKSADVLFLKEGLQSTLELLKISKKARLQIKRNLIAALIYNILGGAAALLGWVNPFVAALLMPASSMFILASTWWGTRP